MANLTNYNVWSFKTGSSCFTQPQIDNTDKLASTAYVWGKVPLTTKGDLLTSDGTINQRISVGSNGQLLYPNSVNANGLTWNSFIQDVSSLTTFTTASTTDVVITNMTLTPNIGTYLALFTGTMFNNSNNRTMTVSLYINGAIVTGGSFNFINASTQNRIPFTIAFPITVTNPIHVVDVRVRTSAGTITINNRYFALIRKSN